MAEELKHLIERIQKEAVDKSEKDAAQIVAQAKEKAAAAVKDAEAKAKAILEKAEKDSQVFVERSQRTLEQAARDLLITVGQGIENILEDIVGEAVKGAMDAEMLKQMMLKIAQVYATQGGAESRIEFLIDEKDQAQIVQFFADQYRQHLVQGLTIRAESGIAGGFRVALKDGHIFHEFTKPAIAEALCNFLRPHLAEIVHRAAREAGDGEQAKS
ncbi:MAG: ATPase [Lentisphaerae bacterium]|nr:ATPase [Lentisphaerota bacterium]